MDYRHCQPQAIANEKKLSTDPLGPRGGRSFGKRRRGPERMPEGIRLGEVLGDAQVVCAAPWPRSAWAYSPVRGWLVVRAEDGR
jgi:hypothetical protein